LDAAMAEVARLKAVEAAANERIANLTTIMNVLQRTQHGTRSERGGSVCLNSFGRFAKWISASIMPPPSLVSAR
jgi:hypothetical protein